MSELTKEPIKIRMGQLPLSEQVAIESRYLGFKHADVKRIIFEKTGVDVPETTVVGWFNSDGKLFDLFYDFSMEQNALRKKEANLQLGALINNAVAVLSQGMLERAESKFTCPHCNQKSDIKMDMATETRIKAAIQVLDRILGKPTQPIEVEDEIKVSLYGDLTTEQLRQRIEETRAQIEELTKSAGGDGSEDRSETDVQAVHSVGEGVLDESGKAA